LHLGSSVGGADCNVDASFVAVVRRLEREIVVVIAPCSVCGAAGAVVAVVVIVIIVVVIVVFLAVSTSSLADADDWQYEVR
jgi:hypothetical protein